MLDKVIQLHELYDLYGPLLSQKQRAFFELYYSEDLSLGEIAEQHHISRQAVYEHIRRAEELLFTFETALHLSRDKKRRAQLLRQASDLLVQSAPPLETLRRLLEQIQELETTGRKSHGF